MNDDDFKQTVLDYINMVATQRHRDQMAQGTEILTKITALGTSFDTMKGTFDKIMTDMGTVIPAGHAAALDAFVAPLDEMHAKIGTFEQEMEAKIKAAIPVPGQGTSPGVV